MNLGELKAKTMNQSVARPTRPTKQAPVKVAAVINTIVPALQKLAAHIEENHKEIAEKDAKIAELAQGAANYLRHLKAAHLVETMVEKGMVPAESREAKIAEVKDKFEVIPDITSLESSMKLAESIVPSLGETYGKLASHKTSSAEARFADFLKS